MLTGEWPYVRERTYVPRDAAVRGAARGGALALPPRPLHQLLRLPGGSRGGVSIILVGTAVLAGPGHCGEGDVASRLGRGDQRRSNQLTK